MCELLAAIVAVILGPIIVEALLKGTFKTLYWTVWIVTYPIRDTIDWFRHRKEHSELKRWLP